MKSLQKIILFLVFAGMLISAEPGAQEQVHIVGRGETIFSLSRSYGVSADELMRVNGLSDPSRLQAGQRLVIPASAASTVSASSTSSASASSSALADYHVVRGDTLFSIARTNGISLQRLLEINGFSANHVLRAGDVIKVPRQGSSRTASPSASALLPAGRTDSSLMSLRWPVSAKNISYMAGELGVIVEGEHNEVVRSLTQGRVVSAGPWRKYGIVTIVEVSGGYLYMYGGFENLSVSVGDRISVGTELGRLGINSVSERPQLFFMVFHNNNPIDPVRAPRSSS